MVEKRVYEVKAGTSRDAPVNASKNIKLLTKGGKVLKDLPPLEDSSPKQVDPTAKASKSKSRDKDKQ